MQNLKYLQNPLLLSGVIFIIAAFFRIFYLDIIEFKYDEAFTVFQLNQFYENPYLMQVGPPQSTGIYNPPLFNYMMIILSLFSRDPQYLSFIIALISSISIILFYLVIRRFYGNMTGVVAALLLATSPWAIIFSRKIWIPDLLLPFLVLFLFSIHKLILEKNTKAALLLFIILALLPQMHASGGFFLITTLVVLSILRIKINFKKATFGFLIGLIPAIPYFIRQLASNPFCIDCSSFLNYQQKIRTSDWHGFIRPFELLTFGNFKEVLGTDYQLFLQYLPVSNIWPFIPYFVATFFLLGALLLFKFNRKLIFLPLYLTFIPAFYFITKTPAYPHYFVITIPIVTLLAALSFKYLWQLFRVKLWKVILLSCLILIVSANLIFEIGFYKFLSGKKIIQGDYGPIFSVTQELIKTQIGSYILLPDYNLLTSYSFMFAQTNFLHQKLGDYFIQTNRPLLAMEEFKKALIDNSQDKYSRANLTYIYIQKTDYDIAKSEIDLLQVQDATLAAKLKVILENNRKQ